LIIWGREDNVIPVEHAERFHRDIKNSKVIIFEKSGHCPMMEDPKETAEACINFFENGLSQ
jgi:pimeloyl-ACP methyl ester carboxylesterase